MEPVPAAAGAAPKKRDTLYLQVLVAIVAGGLLGWLKPEWGVAMQPLGTGFIKLIKLLIAPIIFCTVVAGIAGMGDLKRMGRVGAKALIYFELVTTVALLIGLLVGHLFHPGSGMTIDPSKLDTKSVASFIRAGHEQSVTDFFLNIIPKTFFGAFAEGEILQVLLLAILFGWALARIGEHGRPTINFINEFGRVIFGIVSIVTRLAPIGAFGAMAYTLGKFGPQALVSLGQLLACVYLTCAMFVILVLGSIARAAGFNFWRLLKYIRDEIFIAIGTSSSESALPGLMEKMERVGCARPVVGIVVPAGYSFNLDGTCIYLTCAALFVMQVTQTPMSIGQQLWLLLMTMITSKGAAGITGSGFIVLAATLESTKLISPENLAIGLAMIYGIDRFMSEVRTITNLIGNSVATLVIAKWENAFDASKAAEILAGKSEAVRREIRGDES